MHPVNLRQDGDRHNGTSNETQRVDEGDLNDVGNQDHGRNRFWTLLALSEEGSGNDRLVFLSRGALLVFSLL